jgi:hypothetical protein
LDKNRTLPSEASGDVFEKAAVGVCIKYTVSPVEKLRRVDFDSSEDLDALALTGYRDLRLGSDPRPGCVEGGVLAEACFVCEDERAAFPLGFFLMLG